MTNNNFKVTGLSQEALQNILLNAGVDLSAVQITADVAKQKKIVDKLTYVEGDNGETIAVDTLGHQFTFDGMSEEEINECKKSGLCAKCQSVLKQASEIRKITRVSHSRSTTSSGVGEKIRTIVADNLPHLDEETLQKLCDKDFCQKQFKLSYSLLKDVTNMSSDEIKSVRVINNYPRYSPHIYQVNDQRFIITNNLYVKNLEPIQKFFSIEDK